MKLLLPGAAAALAAFALAAPDAAAGGYHGGYHHPGYAAPQHFRPHHGYAHPYGYGQTRVIVAPAYHPRIIVHPHPGRWPDPRWSGHHWAPRHHFHCQAIGCTRWGAGPYRPSHHPGYGGTSVGVGTGWYGW